VPFTIDGRNAGQIVRGGSTGVSSQGLERFGALFAGIGVFSDASYGSAIVVLDKGYLDTLANGSYVIELDFLDDLGEGSGAETLVIMRTYTLTVNGGSGGNSYAERTQVPISANAAPAGKVFDRWTSAGGGSFADASSPNTVFTMPANAVTVTANYKDAAPDTYALTVNGGSGGGSYAAQTQVPISANAAPAGKVFDSWTSAGGGAFANANSPATVFTMPANAATVTANYKDDPNAGPGGSDTAPAVSGVTIFGAPSVFKYQLGGKNNTVQLTASVAASGGAPTGATWRASGPASVSDTGLVTFQTAEGTAVITATATADATKFASVSIKVARNVTGIRAPFKTYYMQKGKSLTMAIALDDASAKNYGKALSSALSFKSSNTKVLTVDGKGKLSANKSVKKKTKVTVTVTAADGKAQKFTVYVVPKATKLKKLKASGYKTSMKVGATGQIKIAASPASATGLSVSFKSSKPGGLYVDKAGKLVALKKGKYTVTIKAGGKSVKTKKITVK
jgi:hypothetical protein